MSATPITVLVVDDSALMRAMLTEIINSAPDLEVVGAAPDPIAAREMIKVLNPDVLTLDVEMPRMNGLEFLERLMRLRPMPVIMISSLTEQGSEVTLKALELGAVDYVAKPAAGHAQALKEYTEEICDKIRAASAARLQSSPARMARPSPTRAALDSFGTDWSPRLLADTVIAIGASTGGTEAIKNVLSALPPVMPPIVIVQHMPESFTGSFARRLDSTVQLSVVEAQGGERLQPGTVYLAPGHSHLTIRRKADAYVTELNDTEPVNRHRPAVDMLFGSVAECVQANAVGIILTGMGKDGACGMLAMRKAGAWNIGQDQESCVVYGMPREAAALNALDEVASLDAVPARLLARLKLLERQEKRTGRAAP